MVGWTNADAAAWARFEPFDVFKPGERPVVIPPSLKVGPSKSPVEISGILAAAATGSWLQLGLYTLLDARVENQRVAITKAALKDALTASPRTGPSVISKIGFDLLVISTAHSVVWSEAMDHRNFGSDIFGGIKFALQHGGGMSGIIAGAVGTGTLRVRSSLQHSVNQIPLAYLLNLYQQFGAIDRTTCIEMIRKLVEPELKKLSAVRPPSPHPLGNQNLGHCIMNSAEYLRYLDREYPHWEILKDSDLRDCILKAHQNDFWDFCTP